MRPLPEAICLDLIHRFEGNAGAFEPTPVLDPAGHWEIGWSHKLASPDHPAVGASDADALAVDDLTLAATGLCGVLGGDLVTSLSDNRYAALIDFCYNEGVGAFAASTLCQMVKAGNDSAVPAQFSRWVYGKVDGRPIILDGLANRRNAEIDLWNQG